MHPVTEFSVLDPPLTASFARVRLCRRVLVLTEISVTVLAVTELSVRPPARRALGRAAPIPAM